MKEIYLLLTLSFSNMALGAPTNQERMIYFKIKNLPYSSWFFVQKLTHSEKENSQELIATVSDSITPYLYKEFKIPLLTKKQEVVENFKLGVEAMKDERQEDSEINFDYCLNKIEYLPTTLRDSLSLIKAKCRLYLSKYYFSQKKFHEAQDQLNKIKKNELLWPETLLDRSWNYYWLGKNQQALGTILTYESPFLKNYIPLEAYYLQALIYYEMCYFEQAERVLNNFEKLELNTKNYHLDSDIKELKRGQKEIKKEVKEIKKLKSSSLQIELLSYLENLDQLLSQKIKKREVDLKHYDSTMKIQLSQDFVKLGLLISLKKRSLLRNKSLSDFKSEVIPMPLEEILSHQENTIYDFRGGFWADELGDYAIVIKDRCQL